MKLILNGKEIDISNDVISKALEEKKESLVIDKTPFVIRTEDEDNSFKTNIKEESIKIGAEIGRKELFKKLGIEKEGVHKIEETSIAAINEWANGLVAKELANAKIEPNKKVDELTKDLQTLRKTIEEKESSLKNISSEFSTYKKGSTIKEILNGSIPENVILPKQDMATILMSKLAFDVDDNGTAFVKGSDNQPLKDATTLNILPAKNVIENFFNENPQYLKQTTGGAGGSDTTGVLKPNGLEAFDKEMKGKTAQEYNIELNKRIQNKTIEL